jgi:hypothetical protein
MDGESSEAHNVAEVYGDTLVSLRMFGDRPTHDGNVKVKIKVHIEFIVQISPKNPSDIYIYIYKLPSGPGIVTCSATVSSPYGACSKCSSPVAIHGCELWNE